MDVNRVFAWCFSGGIATGFVMGVVVVKWLI